MTTLEAVASFPFDAGVSRNVDKGVSVGCSTPSHLIRKDGGSSDAGVEDDDEDDDELDDDEELAGCV